MAFDDQGFADVDGQRLLFMIRRHMTTTRARWIDMPYTENAGVRIHYETEGSGPALVLLHGFMSSLEDWATCGYLSALRPHYQVIMIDSRGHGESDKPHDEAAYTLDRRVSDVTSVLDALNIDQAHCWGYSMGGYIGYGMADTAPGRLRTTGAEFIHRGDESTFTVPSG
jgi:pimeloyl-ACP methyl ester carboxylesterase